MLQPLFKRSSQNKNQTRHPPIFSQGPLRIKSRAAAGVADSLVSDSKQQSDMKQKTSISSANSITITTPAPAFSYDWISSVPLPNLSHCHPTHVTTPFSQSILQCPKHILLALGFQPTHADTASFCSLWFFASSNTYHYDISIRICFISCIEFAFSIAVSYRLASSHQIYWDKAHFNGTYINCSPK